MKTESYRATGQHFIIRSHRPPTKGAGTAEIAAVSGPLILGLQLPVLLCRTYLASLIVLVLSSSTAILYSQQTDAVTTGIGLADDFSIHSQQFPAEASGSEFDESKDDTGLLQWIGDTSGIADENSDEETEYGIVRNRWGWFQLDLQDCSKPKGKKTEDAIRLCRTNQGATKVQEYILYFAYMPDKSLDQYPFGIPLDFTIRLDWVGFTDAMLSFWQVELASQAPGNTISMYERRLEVEADLNQNGAQDQDQWLANLQRQLEVEAYRFLSQYLNCLRQVKESCE